MREQLKTDTKDAPKAVTPVAEKTQRRADEKMQSISLQKQPESDTLLINKCTRLISSINTSSLFDTYISSKIAFGIDTAATHNTYRSSKFMSRDVPPVSMFNYMTRFYKQALQVEDMKSAVLIFIETLILMDRLCCSVDLNHCSKHRMFAAAYLIATKMGDEFYSNNVIARVAGISLQEINELEVEFLFGIKFKIFISIEEYALYLHKIMLGLSPTPEQRDCTFQTLKYR